MSDSRRRERIVAIILFMLMIALLVALRLYNSMTYPAATVPQRDNPIVTIPKGASARDVSNILWTAKLVPNRTLFLLAAKYKGVDASLQYGEYQFRRNASPWQILEDIHLGHALLHKLTIPEGYAFEQIVALVNEGKIMDTSRFVEAIQKSPFLARHQLHVTTETPLEGFLFPDTYKLSHATPPEEVVKLMLGRFEEVFWNELEAPVLLEGAELLEIVTVASMVEREAVLDEEKPLIAGVIHERLAKNMLVQCDATVRYALQKFKEPLTKEDLSVNSPYNTYRYPGLPAGPICNPGKTALAAALHPLETDYLYYVAKEDGSGGHYFSRDLRTHINAVNKFQRGKNVRLSDQD